MRQGSTRPGCCRSTSRRPTGLSRSRRPGPSLPSSRRAARDRGLTPA
ncbi:MAG TPA: peptidylprolyl isomerase [Clostridiales bacterium]|nr:peptidylprolyl isomerase [Clostridiales bacterium]